MSLLETIGNSRTDAATMLNCSKSTVQQQLQLKEFTEADTFNNRERMSRPTKIRTPKTLLIRLCKKYLQSKEANGTLKIREWSSRSLDLNLIELFWEEMDRRIKKKKD